MASYAIPEPAEFAGEWWLPADGEHAHKVAGSLVWGEERAALSLHDAFTPTRGTIYGNEERRYAAVHGTTTKSELVTILQASSGGGGFAIGQAGLREAERLVSSWVVVGAHVTEETRYSELRLRVPGLEVWVSRGGVTMSLIHKTPEKPATVLYAVEGMSEEITPVPSAALALAWGIDREFSGNLVSDIGVTTSAALRITAEEPQTLEWFIMQFGKAMTLTSFIAGAPMGADYLTAKLPDGRSVDVLVALRASKRCTHKDQGKFFMCRSGMQADLGDVFARWYDRYETIASPSQLALSVFSSEGLWLHVEFLSLMQALEGFHRATMDGRYMDDAEYKAVAGTLAQSIPTHVGPDHREALKARLKWGNEVSLRKRLDALVERLDLSLRQRLLGRNGTFPRSWIHTRNYYTHWDDEAREDAMDGREMYVACARMRLLLRALYLNLVGIPQESIAKALDGACKESQYHVQLNTAEYRKANPGSKAGRMMTVHVGEAEPPTPSTP